MESARTLDEQIKVDEGQLVLFGISFSEEFGTQLRPLHTTIQDSETTLTRRKTDQPERFEKVGDATLPVDPQKRVDELESMRGAGVQI